MIMRFSLLFLLISGGYCKRSAWTGHHFMKTIQMKQKALQKTENQIVHNFPHAKFNIPRELFNTGNQKKSNDSAPVIVSVLVLSGLMKFVSTYLIATVLWNTILIFTESIALILGRKNSWSGLIPLFKTASNWGLNTAHVMTLSWLSFINFKFALRLADQKPSDLIMAVSFACFVLSMAMSVDLACKYAIGLFDLVRIHFML